MVKVIKYWARLENLTDDCPVKQIYLVLKTLDNCGFDTWIKTVRSLLQMYGLEQHWDQPGLADTDYPEIVNKFKCAVYDKYKKEWFKTVSKYPKMRTFISFKTEFKLETYLMDIKSFRLRKHLSKMRLSSHDLEIERGRYKNKQVEHRLCLMCNSGQVEDEEHVIIHCAAYNKVREVLLSVVGVENPECLNGCIFVNLFKSENTRIQFCLGKYIQKVVKQRERYYKTL
jgi:hypothetical protein